MARIDFGRMVLIVVLAAVVAKPALAQDNSSDAGWYLALPQAPILLTAAETGTAVNSSTADQGKKTTEAPSETEHAGEFFGIGTPSGLFGGSDSSSGLGQQSATAGYELKASVMPAASGNILTAPVRGSAVVFKSGVFVYPSLYAGAGRNDNVLSTSITPISSIFYNLRPEAVAELKTHGDRYTLSYLGNYTRYGTSSEDNYNHHDLFLAGDNYFTSRARLGWSVGYTASSDPRGATDRAVSNVPDLWHSPIAHGIFIYGAEKAIGRIELEGSIQNKRYSNNRTTTEASDMDIASLSGRFFYRVMPKTSLLVEIRNTRADYIQSISTNDNTDRRYYVGATWEATVATSGTFKLGRLTKSFTDSSRQDSSGSSWEGSIRWAPLTYSSVDIMTSKGVTDSTGVGDFVINTGTNLVWNHKWASYISSKVSGGIFKSDFAGAERQDNTKNYGLGFFHDLSRWLRAGVDWTYTDRNSTQDIYDFKRNVLMLSIEGTL